MSPRRTTLRPLFALATLVAMCAIAPAPGFAADAASADRVRRLRAAEALATEAKALFRNKAFDAAARQFMEAFATIKRATLVYNAARAREEGAQLKRAESLFLMYLSLPDASPQGKKDARAHIARIRERLAVQRAKKPQAPAAAGEPGPGAARKVQPEPGRGAPAQPPVAVRRAAPSRLPWLVTGGLAVGAGVMWGIAWSRASSLSLDDVKSPTDAADYTARRDSAKTLRAVSVGLGVAAAAAAGWSVWSVMRSQPSAALAPVIAGPEHIGVAWRF